MYKLKLLENERKMPALKSFGTSFEKLKKNMPHKTTRTDNGCPWITTDIRRLIKKKDRAYKKEEEIK